MHLHVALFFFYKACRENFCIRQQDLALENSLYVRVIGFGLSTLRRKPSHMSTRYNTWRLAVSSGNRTWYLDFKERASAYTSETWHLKTRCAWGWSDSVFDFEKKSLTHVNEVYRLKTRCAQWQLESVYRPWGESLCICQWDRTLEDSLCVRPIGLGLSTLSRELLHMPTRCGSWRLTIHGVIGLGL